MDKETRAIMFMPYPHEDEKYAHLSKRDKACIRNNLDSIKDNIARIERILAGEKP